MALIDVALIGGGALHREGLRQSLDPNHFVVVFEGRDFASALTVIAEGAPPKLIIADLDRPSEKDFECLRRVRDAALDCRIVVLSNELVISDVARVFRSGADGYLLSELSREAFSQLLLVVMTGEKVLPGPLAELLASNGHELIANRHVNDQSNLTERERQILRCLLNGYSNKLIARVLDITEGTVKVHLKTLMKKISAVNRTQAALWARSHGIGDEPDPLKAPPAAIARSVSVGPPSAALAGHVRHRNTELAIGSASR
jgi:two-component system nitrate/nitrite response regulator NarL